MLQYYRQLPSKVRLKRDVDSRRFGSKGTPDFSLKLEGLDLCVSGDGRISEKKPTKLVVLTEEMARTLYVASSTISIQTSPRDRSLSGTSNYKKVASVSSNVHIV